MRITAGGNDMSVPGPNVESISEASVFHVDADSSHHGSRDGSRHGSVPGASNYAQAQQASREYGNGAKVERMVSRRLENAALGINDYDQDYAGDYPVERDTQAQKDDQAQIWHTPIAYFKKWIGGIDEVRMIAERNCHQDNLLSLFKASKVFEAMTCFEGFACSYNS